jgi:hypothetical protein
MKLIHNFLQCLLCNSSRWHYLEPLKKGFIEKMAYLVELWFILESNLVERAPQGIFVNRYETITQYITYCNITNTIGLTKFGSVMKKL